MYSTLSYSNTAGGIRTIVQFLRKSREVGLNWLIRRTHQDELDSQKGGNSAQSPVGEPGRWGSELWLPSAGVLHEATTPGP